MGIRSDSLLAQLPAFLPAPAGRAVALMANLGLSTLTRRYQVSWLSGNAPAGRPLRMLLVGDSPLAGWLPARIFAAPPARQPVTRVPAWQLPALLEQLRPQADLTVARLDRAAARLFLPHGYLRVPDWVWCTLDLPVDLRALARRSSSLADDLRVVRRERLGHSISHSGRDLDRFYRTMYAPMARQRHGELAVLTHPLRWRVLMRRGGLMWIERDGRQVGGLLFACVGAGLHLAAVGVLGDLRSADARGVRNAIYTFALDLARARGCTSIDFGASRPSLHDGVLRYKRKWGVRLDARDSLYDVLVHWDQPDALAALLAAGSLIFRHHDEFAVLHGLAHDQASQPGAHAARAGLHFPGLHRYLLLGPPGWQRGLQLPAGVIALDPSSAAPAQIAAA